MTDTDSHATSVLLLVVAGLSATEADAQAWLRCERHRATAEIIVKALLPWVEAGVHPRVAWRWWTADIPVREGVVAIRKGWTPRQYRALMILEGTDRQAGDEPEMEFVEAVEAWVVSGIPPDRALRYRQARFILPLAHAHEARRAAGEDVDQGVAMLAALRQPFRERGLAAAADSDGARRG